MLIFSLEFMFEDIINKSRVFGVFLIDYFLLVFRKWAVDFEEYNLSSKRNVVFKNDFEFLGIL